jgi:hypothetical protein
MTRSPTFSPAAETTTPPPTSDLTARRPSPPGPPSLALPWRHDHPYCPASLSPSRFLSICECQVDGAGRNTAAPLPPSGCLAWGSWCHRHSRKAPAHAARSPAAPAPAPRPALTGQQQAGAVGLRRGLAAGMPQHTGNRIQISRQPRFAGQRLPCFFLIHHSYMGWLEKNDTVRLEVCLEVAIVANLLIDL